MLIFCDSTDRRRPYRNRSRSPPKIDRYQPDNRDTRDIRDHRDHRDRDRERNYYSHSRDHHDRKRQNSPNPASIDRYVPGNASLPALRTNPHLNPMTLDYQVGFNWFAEWWRAERIIKETKDREEGRETKPDREDRETERSQIQAAYDAYKLNLRGKLARLFVQQHRHEEWFKERYVAEFREPIREHVLEFRKNGTLLQWESDLEAGLFDDYTLEGIYKSESDGAGGVIEKEEGEATAVGETLGVLDLVPALGGDLRDQMLSEPALLLKTLAPNVSREKVETFCRENLGDGNGGFRYLSLSDPNPTKKFHRMGWILLNSVDDESFNVIERHDSRTESQEDEGHAPDTTPVTTSVADRALEAVNGKTIQDTQRGDFVCHVGIHSPTTDLKKKALWDLFSAPERVERDLELAKRIIAKFDHEMGEVDSFAKIQRKVDDLRAEGKLQVPVTSGAVVDALKKTENSSHGTADMPPSDNEPEEGEETEPTGGAASNGNDSSDEDDVDSEETLVQKKLLDLTVEYLRRVHNFCLFCVTECDSVHELMRKCPGGHLRRPRSGLSTQSKAVARASAAGQSFPIRKNEDSNSNGEQNNYAEQAQEEVLFSSARAEQQAQRAFNWVKTFENKVFQILEPESVDLSRLGGKPVDEAVHEELHHYVKQEDESRFRCKVPECSKLFKADAFWRKHVEKRHPDWLAQLRNDFALVNSYVLDPAHVSPVRPDLAGPHTHHFPHLAGGSSRGGHTDHYNPSSASSNAGMNKRGLVGGGSGPVRRGGGRSALHPPYYRPYDRALPARPLNGHRLSGAEGPTNVSDTVNGAGAVGPPEAVQGRSLRSYEDLDAVGGAGSGELNY